MEGNIYGYPLSKSGDNYCPADTDWTRITLLHAQVMAAPRVRKASGIDMARDGTTSDNIMYVVSHVKNKIQKIELS